MRDKIQYNEDFATDKETKPVAAEGVKEEGESEAEDGADEEEEEDELLPDVQVRVALVAQRLHVEDNGADHKGNEANQVSPDVALEWSVNRNNGIVNEFVGSNIPWKCSVRNELHTKQCPEKVQRGNQRSRSL